MAAGDAVIASLANRYDKRIISLMIKIRRATVEDIPWLLVELKKFAACGERRLSVFPDDPELGAEVLKGMLEHHVLFIAAKAELLMGLIGGVLVPHFFNPKIRQLAEMFWWVAEEHRGSRAGLLLLNAFVDYGKSHADWVTVALEAMSPVHEKCLTRRGFKLQERAYLLEVS